MRLKHFLSVFLTLLTLSVGQMWGDTGTLVSALNGISSGDTYYIAALYTNYYTVPNTTISGQTFTCTQGSYNSTTQKLTPASGAGEFVLTAVSNVSNAYYIYNTNLKKYLVATGSKTFGYVESSSSDYGYWTFSTVASGGFSGQFSVTHSSKTQYMRAYNNSVRCYDGTSNNGVYLFKKDVTSFTVTASSNNNSWGTVAVSGTTITATPTECYQVANGTSGYNKVSGTATITHTGNSNTISVTPTSNCSIQVIFEKKIVNTYVDEIQGNEDIEDCGTHDAPSLDDKTPATTGTCAEQHYHFMGWVTAANKANPTDANIITAGTEMTANGTTYYAVWAKSSAGSCATVTFKTNNSDSSTDISSNFTAQVDASSGMSSYSGSKVYSGSYGLKVGTGSAVGTVTCTLSSAITTKTITVDAKKYGSNNTNISVKVNGSTNFGSAQAIPATGDVLTFSLAANADPIAVSSVTVSTASKQGYIKTITVGEAATYSDYITTCCTPLASINGSVSVTSGTAATLSWSTVTGAESYKVKVPGSSNCDDWTTATSPFSVTGLTAGQNYTAYFKAFDSNGSHCTEGPESTTAFTTPKITVTGTLNPFVYIHNSGPSAAQSITVSAVGMAGNVTIAAPDYFEVCETENGTYTSSVSLTPTSGTVASTTIYVRLKGDLDEGTYGISNVVVSGNYAASVNVSVSGTVSPSCHTPSISVQPTASVSYNLNATATALSVTAAKGDNADPALTYQWKQCATINGDYANVASNGTSSTYTPSTAAIGTIYYKCEVSSGACSKLSDAAAVTVNTPTITVGDNKTSHAFGDKAIGSENTVTISVSGANLAKDQNIGLALSGAGVSAYAIDKTSITASNGTVSATDVTITYTAAAGLSEATLTISSAGAVSKEIALSGTGKYQATFIANGNSESILVDGEGKLVLPTSTPSSCNGTYSTFIGWYSTAAGSNGDPTTDITECGTKAVTTHVLEGNETYYAVWGNGALSADEVKQVTLDFTDNSEWGFPTDSKETESASYTQNGVTITMGGDVTDGWKFDATNKYFIYGKSGCTMTFSAFSFDVSKIVVTGRTGASSSTKQNVFVGSTAVSTETTGSTGTYTYAINSNYKTAGTIYVLKVNNAYNAQATKIEIYSPGKAATGFISSCCTKHNVSISNGLVNGSVTSSLASACEGTSVTLTATPTPNAGRFKTWSITGLDSYSTTTNPLTFDMPDKDITVSATFDALYAITKELVHGSFDIDKNYAIAGETVTISNVAADAQYENPQLEVYYIENEVKTTVSLTNNTFLMPAHSVKVKVSCSPAIQLLDAPVLGEATDATYQSVTLNWTGVVGNEGYVLTVQQGGVDVEGLVNVAIDQNATSYTIASGLSANTAYTYSIYTKGNGTTTMEVNTPANGNFSTVDYPTVKLYYSENGELSAGVDQKILTDFTLPNEAAECSKTFIGWTTAANASYSHASTAPDPLYAPGKTDFQIPTNANCTLYAVYADVVEGSASYDKVTSAPVDWSGDYLIVYEEGNVAFNGGLETLDAVNNTISVTISENAIVSNVTTDAAKFTIAAVTGGYSIKSARKYIGQGTDANGLTSSETAMTNTISATNDGDANIVSSGGAYLRYNADTNQERFRYYKSSSYTNQKAIQLYKKNVTEASVTNYVTICQGKVAKPVISGVTDGTTYEEAKTITITSATNGATIYYSINGQDPATEYTEPFTLSDNGEYTIRAYATKSDMIDSDEADEVSVTIDKPFTTIASFIEAAPATAKKLAFTAESNARVLAYNKNRIYIQDGTGAMFLYNTGSNNEGHGKTWASGKKIVGTLTGTYLLTNNMPRMTVTDFGATDVTDDAIELPTPIAVEALATNFESNVCKLVTISGVSIRSESVADNNTINMTKNDVTYNIYNAFNALTSHTLPLNSTSCTVTGILGQSNSGNTLQLMPISADGISTNGAEAVLPVLSVTGSTNSAEPFEVATNKVITFTPNSNFDAVYAINDGEEAAVTGSSNVTITDEANATKVTIRATREYYTTKEVSYYYRANSALIEYDITKGAMSHGSATIQNAQGDAITYAVGGATVTLVANPAEHYHWVSWEVTAGGEPVTVTNNTFEMPNAAVTVSATFAEDDYATVAFAKGNESVTGTVPTSQKVYVGENATMPGKGSMILSSHNFAGWKLGSNAVLNAGDTYTVTAADHEAGTITFEAQWEPYPWASAGKWELVTDEEDLNAGDYVVIACNSQKTIAGEISSNIMASVGGTFSGDKNSIASIGDACVLTLGKSDDNWTFTNVDAELLGATEHKKLAWGSGTTTWSISIADAEGEYKATIQNTTSTYGRFLYNSGTPRFTTYTSNTSVSMILPQLYKFVGGSYYNIVYAKGTEDVVRNMPEGHVTDENGEAAIKENTPIRVGYTFTGWKDQDENAYTYNDGQIYTFTKNVTLTAQWEEQTDKYTVSYDANGSSDAVPADVAYFENEEVTVAGAVSKEGFVFMGWECNGRVYTAGSKFYMPATDMPMVAKYAHGATYVVDTKTSVTMEGSVPEGSSATFVNTNNTPKQITSGKTMTLTLSGYTGYTIKGVQLNAGTNNSSGEGTLSITIGGDEVATGANADKWYDGNHHYGTNNGTDFESVLVSMNPKTVKYGEDIVITIAASENSLYCQSFTILYDLLPVEVENTTTIEARDLAAGTEVIIHDGGTLNVNADKTLDNLTVEAGGQVSGGSALTVNNLTINSEAGKSGQVMNENVTVNGDIYLDIKLLDGTDPMTVEESQEWYCISAPFDVNMNGGFFWGDGTPMGHNVDFQAFLFDGAKRANTGVSGWQRVSGKMEAGRAYLIGFDDARTNQKTIRLKAMSKDIPTADKLPTTGHDADEANKNWNGVGNPTLHYIALDGFTAKVQCYNNGSGYSPYDPTTHNYVVGTTLFMQAENEIYLKAATNENLRAPKRNNERSEKYSFCVEIAKEGASRCDNRLYVSTSDEATASYESGKDMSSMNGTSSKFGALIWTENYGMRLASEDIPMVNDKAKYTLGIYAPKEGTYSISTTEASEDADLYLTYNGKAIWNLSMNAYEAELAKGQNEGYGLLLVKKMPQTPTGIENGGMLNGANGVQKVILDEKVFILRGGKMYDVTGKAVK